MKTLYTLCLVLSISSLANAQIEIKQFASHSGLLNPAAVGLQDEQSVAILYQNQWSNYYQSPKQLIVHADHRLKEKSGLGIQMRSYSAGVSTINNYQLFYAYRLKLSESVQLGLGLNLGAQSFRINQDRLENADPNDPLIQDDLAQQLHISSGFATQLTYATGSIGIHLPQLVHNYQRATEAFSINAEQTLLNRSENKVSLLLRSVHHPERKSHMIGLDYTYKSKFGVGVLSSNHGSLFFQIQAKFMDQIALGFCYGNQGTEFGYSGNFSSFKFRYFFN